MQSSQQLVKNLKTKTYKKSDIQIAYRNKKLDKILIQLNASQNLQQTIKNSHNDFQSFSNFITGRFDNIYINESSNYLMEDSHE